MDFPGTWRAVAIVCGIAIANTAWGQATLEYPKTKQMNLQDDYHGVPVADPYRWLEDDVRTSADVQAWVEAQNKVTASYLESIAAREPLRARLTELWNYEKYSSPSKRGGRYYYLHNTGLQNQFVLYTMESLSGEPRVLIDPNTWSEDGTVALAGVAPSEDGRYIAYGVQDAGSDWVTWRIMEIDSGKLLDDELKWIKFSSVDWTLDGQGLFYCRFDEPKEGEQFQGLNLNQKLFYHRVNTPQSEDVLVYCRPDHPDWGFQATVTEDGRYLVITVFKGTDDKYRVLYKDLHEPYGMPVELIDNFDNEYTFVGNDATTFYFKTDLDAARKRLIAIDLRHPQREAWQEVIPQSDNVLDAVHFVGNLFIATYLKDARSQVLLYSPAGKLIQEVELPGIGSAGGFGGKRTDTETFYVFSSFAAPPSIYQFDLITREHRLWRRAEVPFNPEDYVTTQVFYQSKDGTRVPMFLTHKKNLKRDGKNPTLLYGYGGFNISLTPSFSVGRVVWMELGGVYAVPNLRGGGEYGEQWHQAGTKLNKQNVFDDFIAAAQWLIENGYTSPERLAIQGGSNGGLLVGAAMTQRPDLFGACLPAVGVMDMLRFHKFTAGRLWVDDYGSSDDPEQFKALLAYSPYHNIKPGTDYPATLITTADYDDRVVPGHSFKFAARLQECQAGPAPVLIRIETRAGHGAGKPTAKSIEETADLLAFLTRTLHVPVQP